MKRIVLIDGRNQLYRMAFAPSLAPLARKDGFPTGSIYGCISYSLLALATKLKDTAFVWCWDGEGETWRHRMMATPHLTPEAFPDEDEEPMETLFEDYAQHLVQNTINFFGPSVPVRPPKKQGYKGNRTFTANKSKSKYPEDPKSRALLQLPVLQLILRGAGIRSFEVKGLECDDLIGILTKHITDLDDEVEVMILSGDRDFYQLLVNDRVRVVKNNKGGELQYVKPKQVEYEHRVSVRDWIKYRAWTGDKTDNIPHVFKIGPVRARMLLDDGFDPSVEDFKKLDVDDMLCTKYAKFFAPHGIKRMWPSVYSNYQLCRIVTSPDDKLLSEEVQDKLYTLMKPLTSLRAFGTDKTVKTSDNYRKLSFLLAQYDLASLVVRRDELWELP